jgi:uncharacterized repeat protein (TIGR01451 family)
MRPAVRRFAVATFCVGACALIAGCLSGNPSYFPYLIPPGPEIPTHPKPAGPGYYEDFDPNACRIVLRPESCNARTRSTQVFIATVYDGDNVPRRKRRVEWMIEGPGSIIEVDESGITPGRGMKFDNKYAYSTTDYFEHCLNRGGVDFTIGPGQTWCVVTSAVEGETTVTAYAPAIFDWNKNRAYARITWSETGAELPAPTLRGSFEFPRPITAKAGGEYTLGTKVAKGDGAEYRIRYSIIDGPPAALNSTRGTPVDSVTEAVTTFGADGQAKVSISQPAAVAGTNRIAIEVIKTNAGDPTKYTVVSKGETTVIWQAAQLGVNVNAPKSLALNQDVTVTYAVTDNGAVEAGAVTLTARVPPGMNVVQTIPRAAIDGDEMIWTLPAGTKGKAQTVKATFRPAKVGSATLTADARSHDGTSGHGTLAVSVTEAKLLLKLEGPTTGVVGESLPFQVTVTNTGDGSTGQVTLQARLADGLQVASRTGVVEQTISSLAPGQSKTITLPVAAVSSGKHQIQATATANNNLNAPPQDAIVEVQDAQIGLTAHGPSKGYIGEEITWQLVVRNNGDVPMGRVSLKATLPPEVTFIKATDGGKVNGRQVTWDLGTAPSRQERAVAITVSCDKPTGKTMMQANVVGSPASNRDGAMRTVSLIKPVGPDKPVEAVLEIVGVPALQVSVKDSNDPIGVGQKTIYTVKVKNAGTMAASKIVVTANVPTLMRPIRATGPAQAGTIDKQSITFPALATLAPNAEASYVIEVEALVPGDARFRVEVQSDKGGQPLRAEEPTKILDRLAQPSGQ